MAMATTFGAIKKEYLSSDEFLHPGGKQI